MHVPEEEVVVGAAVDAVEVVGAAVDGEGVEDEVVDPSVVTGSSVVAGPSVVWGPSPLAAVKRHLTTLHYQTKARHLRESAYLKPGALRLLPDLKLMLMKFSSELVSKEKGKVKA